MQPKYLQCMSELRVSLVPFDMSKASSDIFADDSKAVLLLLHVTCYLCYANLAVPCSLVITCWERTDLLVLFHVVFSCVFASSPAKISLAFKRAQPLVEQDGVFVTFPYGVPGQEWYLIISIANICLFQNNLNSMVAFSFNMFNNLIL